MRKRGAFRILYARAYEWKRWCVWRECVKSERFKNFSFSPSSCQRSGTPKNTVRVTVKIFGLFWEKRNPKQEREKEDTRRELRRSFLSLLCVVLAQRGETCIIKGGERKGAELLLLTRFQRTIYLCALKQIPLLFFLLFRRKWWLRRRRRWHRKRFFAFVFF